MSSVRAVSVLVFMIACAATQLGVPIVNALVMPFLGALLAAHIDRRGGELASLLVKAAATLLPRGDRADFRAEWLDHVSCAGERGVSPLTRAASIALIAAPCLALGLRVGRRRRRGAG